jgi:hypothetical protein
VADTTAAEPHYTEPSWEHHRARIAGLRSRGRAADAPEVIDAQRDLAAARLAEHIRKVVDTAPPLTPEQIEQLRGLLPAPTAELTASSARGSACVAPSNAGADR